MKEAHTGNGLHNIKASHKLNGSLTIVAILFGLTFATVIGHTQWLTDVFGVLTLLSIISIGYFFTNSVFLPMRQVVVQMRNVAHGKYESLAKLEQQYHGADIVGESVAGLVELSNSTKQLGQSVDQLTSKLKLAVDRIAQSAEQTGSATEQVAQTIQQVSTGAQSQTTQLLRSSDSVEELSRQSIVLKDESEQAMGTMQTLKSHIATTSETIELLGKRSSEIGTIVLTIEEIADQTNLLALNAAIEAARAGDHGRGFAVVADEVRKLAERSAEATREIGKIIREIQKETTKAVDVMGESVSYVDASVDKVKRTLESAEVMAQKSQEVNGDIASVASVSEENGAAAEEVSAATQEMTAQVREVAESIQELTHLTEELQAVRAHVQYQDAASSHQSVSTTKLPHAA